MAMVEAKGRYDSIFAAEAKHLPALPMALLKAIAWRESGMDPKARGPGSSATGLFQILDATRGDFNSEKGKSYTREEMEEPPKATEVGAWLLRKIIASYTRNHPKSLDAQNWTSRRFIEAIAQGYNAGWSETAGVGFVVGAMEKQGTSTKKISPESIGQVATALKLSSAKWLDDPERQKYAHRVADTYFEEVGRKPPPLPEIKDDRLSRKPDEEVEPSRIGMFLSLGLVGFVFFAIAALSKGR